MNDKMFYGQYIVIMMDLLGQTEAYKTLENFPLLDLDKNEDFLSKLREFITQINNFKKDIDSFIENFENYQSPRIFPEVAKDFVNKSRKTAFKQQRFSDCIMLYVPLEKRQDSFPIMSVYKSLLCTCSTMLVSLCRKNPIRVGIGLGGAVEIDEGELFGPAIGSAHAMESKSAIYPRIAIDPKVLSYLDSYTELHQHGDIENKFVAAMASICRSLIKKDFDGVYILDYLGEAAWNLNLKNIDQRIFEDAFGFVVSQREIYRQENNSHLLAKYSYVCDYFTASGRT